MTRRTTTIEEWRELEQRLRDVVATLLAELAIALARAAMNVRNGSRREETSRKTHDRPATTTRSTRETTTSRPARETAT